MTAPDNVCAAALRDLTDWLELVDRIAKVVRRASMRNSVLKVTPIAVYTEGVGQVCFCVRAKVPDRTTGEPVELLHHHRLKVTAEITDDELLEAAYQTYASLYTHELNEAWHVDDIRVRDPHAVVYGRPFEKGVIDEPKDLANAEED